MRPRLESGGSARPLNFTLGAMTALAPWAVVCGGFYAGFVGASLVTTTLRFIYRSRMSTTHETPRQRKIRLATIPGLLLGILGLGYLTYSGSFTGRWDWFAGGFLLSIAYVGTLVFWAMRTAERKRIRAAGA